MRKLPQPLFETWHGSYLSIQNDATISGSVYVGADEVRAPAVTRALVGSAEQLYTARNFGHNSLELTEQSLLSKAHFWLVTTKFSGLPQVVVHSDKSLGV